MMSLQQNMQTPDELSALFNRNLTLNPQTQPEAPRESQHLDPIAAPSATQPLIYSTSQHYHHSVHAVKPQPNPEDLQRPSSEPPQSENASSEAVLRMHGIDPSTLTPSQVQLFRIADPPQKRRLLELWSICPPSSGGDIPALAWSSTTLEHEEQLARMRYDMIQQQNQMMSLDGTAVQRGDGRWPAQSQQESEPYILSGYEELMRRDQERQQSEAQEADGYNTYSRATDPVYMGPDFARQQQQIGMATQYGAYEHFRAAAEGDTMMDVM